MTPKLEKTNKPKPELTGSRRQTLEDLKETLVGFMSADLSDETKEKIQDLIDATENEIVGNESTGEESSWKIE